MHLVFVLPFVLTVINGSFAIESNFYMEENCANITGACVLESECPHSVPLPHKNQCPMQKKDGAVCCTDFPESELNCYQLHEACLDWCAKFLDRGRKGCPEGKTCCTLIF
ncbi:hypothetical protein Zmor_026088 [Zophobas morio]|uniref:Uncharacterized protein n=1 Tax=Zophobas morio TaxID=2755281 RepID=A0AA38M4U0_9CUCU|nr:hypothetical protein Zmor_026088 [Zophobas morio]